MDLSTFVQNPLRNKAGGLLCIILKIICKTTPRAENTCSTLSWYNLLHWHYQSPQIWPCFAGEWTKRIFNRMVRSLCGLLPGAFPNVKDCIKNHGMPAGGWQMLELLAPRSQPPWPSLPFRNSPEDEPFTLGTEQAPEPGNPQRYSKKLRQETVYLAHLWFRLSSSWKGAETYAGTFSVAHGCDEHSCGGPKVAF